MRKYLSIYESVEPEVLALEEIKSKAKSTYRNTGLVFGTDGMGEIYNMRGMIAIGTLISLRQRRMNYLKRS